MGVSTIPSHMSPLLSCLLLALVSVVYSISGNGDKSGFESGGCEQFHWSRWGRWGGCSSGCEKEWPERHVKRHRKCEDYCSKEEFKGRCDPSEPTPTKPALAD